MIPALYRYYKNHESSLTTVGLETEFPLNMGVKLLFVYLSSFFIFES